MTATATFADRYGLPLSTRSEAAASAYVDGLDRLLALTAGSEERLRETIAADDGFALAHAALAIYLQSQLKTAEATASAERARERAAGATAREQRHVEAIALAVAGDTARASALIREQLAEYPRDALLLRQAEFLRSASGSMRPDVERLAFLETLAPAYGDDWYFLASHAMALQDLGRLEEARRLAERSLALHPRAAASAHPVAHVFYESGDHEGGVAFLEPWLDEYEPHAPYYSHLNWHLALFELAEGRHERVMALYERAMQPAVAAHRIGIVDSASLLWRCQLYGTPAGPLPWQAVGELVARVLPRPGLSFFDLHAALAYVGAGDQAALGRLIDGLRVLGIQGHPTAGSVVLPLVRGIAAFSEGDYAQAVRWIEPVADQVVRVGGSHAQREVFEDTLLEAYLRAGRYEEAEALLRKRLDRRPSARDLVWLSRAQAADQPS